MKRSYEPDPKPEKRPRKQIRIKDTGAMRRKMLRESGRCRGVDCQQPASQAHHIIRKGSPNFGDDVEENIMPLCLYCHHDYHAGRKPELRFTVEEYEYVLEKLGQEKGHQYLLDRYGKVRG